MSDEGGGGWCPVAKRCVASRQSSGPSIDEQAQQLIEEARREANSEGYTQAIVVEGNRIWIWRHDWLIAAMHKELERGGQSFKHLRVLHIIKPDY